MQCVILAAGRGERMRPLTDTCPKPMLSIKNKPKLAYSIETLPESITEVILIVGYLKEVIMDYFGNEYAGKKMTYVEHHVIDGTAKVLWSAKHLLTDRFLVLMGDDLYCRPDLEKLLQYDLAVLAMDYEHTENFGVLKTDPSGRLSEILEKPHPLEYTLVNTGAYVLKKEFFEYEPVQISEKEYGLPQTLIQMVDKHSIEIVLGRCWMPIGDPEALEEARNKIDWFLDQQ